MKKVRTTLLFVLALNLGAILAAQTRRPMTAEDAVGIKAVGNTQISPDGSHVVFTVRELDLAANEFFTNIWIVPVSGGEARRFTAGLRNDTNPLWSPDGKWIAFLSGRETKRGSESERSPKAQVWLIPFGGGEAQPLTEAKSGVGGGFCWSPDGRKIAFTSAEPPTEQEEKRLKEKRDMIHVDRDIKMNQLWLVDVETRQARQLTHDRADVRDPQWSRDGREIAYVRRPTPKADDTLLSDIMIIPADGGPARLLVRNEGPDTSPAWSPDGRNIAYLAGERPHSGGQNDVLVIPAAGGQARNLTAQFDRNESNPLWSPDGRTIHFEANLGANRYFFSVPSAGGPVKQLVEGYRGAGSISLSNDGRTLAHTLTDPLRPADVWVSGPDGGNARALTRMNPQVEGFQLGSTELVRWKNPDGGEIEGVLVKPADFQAGRKYPMIVEPHGGPAGIQQTRFNATWQVYAGRGYVVFAPNFRGSDGYGKAFIEANVGKWGVVDFQDIMSGVDHVISLGFVDPDRMGVEGWSYGGYMSQFIVSHTDRFKAAVPGAGMSNMISFYGTTDIQRFTVWYMTGHPWETLEIYRRSSPIFNVDKVKTPTRILFGEQDRRVPIEQGEQFYTALKQRGIEVEMIRYPREPHGLQEPYHQIDRIERTVEWFDRFLKK
ncbi:MAG: S9 family peptidase [Acidobacteria bacterium]|nr:S9 family peptidase [Acidobacteriota bacterium]